MTIIKFWHFFILLSLVLSGTMVFAGLRKSSTSSYEMRWYELVPRALGSLFVGAIPWGAYTFAAIHLTAYAFDAPGKIVLISVGIVIMSYVIALRSMLFKDIK